MNERSYRWLRVVGIILLVVIALYGVVAINVYSSVGRLPTESRRPAPHIRDIVWPTIGYPAIVSPGGEMNIELDLPAEAAGSLKATLTPACPDLAGLIYELEALSARSQRSERWPAGTAHGRGSVLEASFRVPEDAVPELYSLSVEASAGGRHSVETQPNSVSVARPRPDGSLRFVSLTDVHVHERNISGFMAPMSDKGIAADGTPVFFQRAIEQVNTIRPDFVVMMGDYVYAQRSPGELAREFEAFYTQLPRFRVPVFMAAGNHDQYVNGVDGARVFEENIGPLFFSFDVGANHFTVANTYQWSAFDRTVMSKFFGLFVYPRKWQGQVVSASDERKPETFRGQLAWLRDDLAAHGDSVNRFMVMHHDPFRPNGKAASWKNERFAGIISFGGGGSGSKALRTLAARYGVDYVLTGHTHSDYVGEAPSLDRKGTTKYVNQTLVGFDSGGMRDSYPGYRLWKVKGRSVTGYAYLDDYHSMPLYDGSVLDGKTDTDKLERPAVSRERTTRGFRLESYLGVSLLAEGLIGVFPSSKGYEVTGGAVYRSVPLPRDPALSLLYVSAVVERGVPGASAARAGRRAVTEVVIRPQ